MPRDFSPQQTEIDGVGDWVLSVEIGAVKTELQYTGSGGSFFHRRSQQGADVAAGVVCQRRGFNQIGETATRQGTDRRKDRDDGGGHGRPEGWLCDRQRADAMVRRDTE